MYIVLPYFHFIKWLLVKKPYIFFKTKSSNYHPHLIFISLIKSYKARKFLVD